MHWFSTLSMWFFSASGLQFVHSAANATLHEAIEIHMILVFVAGKLITVFTNETAI